MPLNGIRVIEVAGLAPVPFCGMILADYGATVIRVDKVGSFMNLDRLSRGKQSVAIDLQKGEGQEIVRSLTANSDIFLDPFRPGVMEKLNLGPERLLEENPRLIYCRISGYGQTGPYSKQAGHDINYVSLSGLLSRLGPKDDNPFPPINLLADMAGGGLNAAFGIMLALHERHSSGKGQVIDCSMTEGAAYVGSFIFKGLGLPYLDGTKRGENMIDGLAHFYNTYKTKDSKYVAVGPIEPKFYKEFIKGLGLSDEPVAKDQYDNYEEYKKLIGERFSTKNRDEWVAIFDKSDACVTHVLEFDEVAQHPQHQEREFFVKNPHTGQYEPEPSPRLSRTPGKANLDLPDPREGEHTLAILQNFGYSKDNIEILIEKGIVASKVY